MDRARALAKLGPLAMGQKGLVTARQARDLGVSGTTLVRLRKSGAFERVGYGIYRSTDEAEPPEHLDIWVAWLRLDPRRASWERDGTGRDDAVVSHASACLLHQLGQIPAPWVELTAPRRRATREPGVRLHWSRDGVAHRDIELLGGLPATTPERTVIDLLRAGADGGHVGSVIVDVVRRALADLDALAHRAERFADRYAMEGVAGREMLAILAAQSGSRLQETAVARRTGRSTPTTWGCRSMRQKNNGYL